jgi:hypothetical protein
MEASSGALRAPPSRAPVVGAILALLVGGAIATAVWWLTDNDVDLSPDPVTHVIVADTPVAPTGAVAAKNEAGVAAAVGGGLVQERYGAQATNREESPTSSLSGVDGSAQQYSGVKDYSKNGATGDYAYGPLPPAGPVNSARSDGGPEEGTRGPH